MIIKEMTSGGVKKMDYDSAKKFLMNQKWIEAKTYRNKAPHEYCLRREVVGTEEEFERVVEFIREVGEHISYWSLNNIYLFVDGKMYWTMGSPINETILINRCDVDDYEIFEKGGKRFVKWKGPKK